MEDLKITTQKYIDDPLSIYDDNFFRGRTRGRVRGWEKNIGSEIVNFFKISSIVDFGCGLGSFLEGAQEKGARIMGFEYGYEKAKGYLCQSIAPFIQYGNVMEKIDCGVFDCSMSIEVAEHILTEKSDELVSNLARSSNKYIILTAAPPGQGGTGHINEQPKQFWIDKFEKLGFKLDVIFTQSFLTYISEKKMKLPKHVRRNIMVFQKVN